MEKLSDLPPKADTKSTPQERDVIEKYFDSKSDDSSKSGSSWKLVAYTSLLFLALANPWLDGLFKMLPYCGESQIAVLFIKLILFAIVFAIIYNFAV